MERKHEQWIEKESTKEGKSQPHVRKRKPNPSDFWKDVKIDIEAKLKQVNYKQEAKQMKRVMYM